MVESYNIEVLNKQDLTKTVPLSKEVLFKCPDLLTFKKFNKNEYPKETSGIYVLIKKEIIFYIGRSFKIKERLKNHKRRFLYDSYLFLPINSLFDLEIIELILIQKYKPLFNIERFEGESECMI